jgi:hypothetical protein
LQLGRRGASGTNTLEPFTRSTSLRASEPSALDARQLRSWRTKRSRHIRTPSDPFQPLAMGGSTARLFLGIAQVARHLRIAQFAHESSTPQANGRDWGLHGRPVRQWRRKNGRAKKRQAARVTDLLKVDHTRSSTPGRQATAANGACQAGGAFLQVALRDSSLGQPPSRYRGCPVQEVMWSRFLKPADRPTRAV